MVSEERDDRTRYECVVGHEIPRGELETRTAVWSLDTGAQVQVCLEHGAPIALWTAPVEAQPAEAEQ